MATASERLTALRAHPDRLTLWLIGALVGVGTIIRVPQLFHSLAEAYAFRQSQTAFTVREYGEHGINLLTTPLPVFGPTASVPMEFPLFQGIASLLVTLGLTSDMAARTLGLLAFQASAILLSVLLIRWHGRVVAIVAVTLFEFLPFGLLWGASSLIDFMSVALALLMVAGLDRWFNQGSGWWLAAAIVGAVAGFLVKVTTVPSWGFLVLISIILVVRDRGWAATWKRIVIGLVSGPGVGFLGAILWTLYADSVKRQQEITEFLTSSALREWNFGTLAQRADPQNYVVIIDRVAQEIAGPLVIGLIVAIAAAIYQKTISERLRTLAWLAVIVSGPLVFFNLYIVHSYYLIAIYPAIVTAVAIGIVWLTRNLPGMKWQRWTAGAVLVGLLFVWTATSPNGRMNLAQFVVSQSTPALSNLLLDQTQPGDQIVIIGCDWDPTFLYYAERAGVMFRGSDSGRFWSTEDVGDYAWLFNCRSDLTVSDYLPTSVEAMPTEFGGLYSIVER